MTVIDLCTRHVVVAAPDDTVIDAARRMRASHVGDLVIVDQQRRPVGVLTDRDIVVTVVAQGAEHLAGLRVGDVMTASVVAVQGREDVGEAIGLMRRHGIRRLPVIGLDGRLEGVLTLDDLLGHIAAELGQIVGLITHEQRRERTVRAAV
jgi:CBS domain-containing protein